MIFLQENINKLIEQRVNNNQRDENDQQQEINIERVEQRKKKRKTISNIIVCIIGIIHLLIIGYIEIGQKSLIIDFNQHVNILSPYLSEQEVKILKSEWALMRNEEDYKKIAAKLFEYAQKNNIELP